MKTYEIKYEPIKLKDGSTKDKYNVYYYLDKEEETVEFHSTDGINGVVKEGYTLKTK